MGDPISIAGLVLSAAGTASSFLGAKKQQKAEQRRFDATTEAENRRVKLEARRQDVIASRQRRAAAAEAKRNISRAQNLANAQGAGGAVGAAGSTVPGVNANITSQLNANQSFVNTVTSLTNDATAAGSQVNLIASQPITAGSGLQALGALAKEGGGLIFDNAEAIEKALPF